MFVTTLAWMTACSGSDPATPEDPATGGPLRPQIQCAEGRTLESSNSAKGEEQWCDRAGMMDGPYVKIFPNGEKASKGTYLNNMQDGDWWSWHDNGQEASKGKYTKGKKTGPWTWWHPNGNRAEEGDYLMNRKQGQWTAWYESGMKKEEGLYHNDGKNGVWTYFNDDAENTIAKTERYENGGLVETKGTDPVVRGATAPAPAPQ
jgi:antitoxin component YwqK of YwqJK toxin-antitoxin module